MHNVGGVLALAALVVLVAAAGAGWLRSASRSHGCHAHDDPAYSVEAILTRLGWERIEAEPVEGYVDSAESTPVAGSALTRRWPSTDGRLLCGEDQGPALYRARGAGRGVWPGTDPDTTRELPVPQQRRLGEAPFRPSPVPHEHPAGRHALRA
ncbi:hypothetical protein [Amycolatopsis cihanbeyliensis]|uniref:Uncharacterized protein n=1 Tax=Amycolatopsis cihanbeyliensis TaxID=1128664 RepID=A0A542DL19_AMYCI|nr:hypothetical protein [Amycolatopsis cihanbeyliensis]TQJ03790.1 hypothetical protein FB471_3558 [Amycolatopsis cihanbeyliensis]